MSLITYAQFRAIYAQLFLIFLLVYLTGKTNLVGVTRVQEPLQSPMLKPASYHDIMAVTSGLISVADFARLPQPAGGIRQELHHGELVELPPAKKLHTKLEKRLVTLLQAALNPGEQSVAGR